MRTFKAFIIAFFISLAFNIILLIQLGKKQPVIYAGDSAEVLCLARNIFFESRGEKYWGKIAVASVTLNRASQKNKTICQVVYEPFQFSWTVLLSERKQRKIINKEKEAWGDALMLATKLYNNPENYLKDRDLKEFDHFYNPDMVQPSWHKGEESVKIGNHVFVKLSTTKSALKIKKVDKKKKKKHKKRRSHK